MTLPLLAGGYLPIKRCAPEILADPESKCKPESDVWMFGKLARSPRSVRARPDERWTRPAIGIAIWEVLTGQKPFANIVRDCLIASSLHQQISGGVLGSSLSSSVSRRTRGTSQSTSTRRRTSSTFPTTRPTSSAASSCAAGPKSRWNGRQ